MRTELVSPLSQGFLEATPGCLGIVDGRLHFGGLAWVQEPEHQSSIHGTSFVLILHAGHLPYLSFFPAVSGLGQGVFMTEVKVQH